MSDKVERFEERAKARRRAYHMNRSMVKEIAGRESWELLMGYNATELAAEASRRAHALEEHLAERADPVAMALAVRVSVMVDELRRRGVQLQLF
jgi:hypothetical protein